MKQSKPQFQILATSYDDTSNQADRWLWIIDKPGV